MTHRYNCNSNKSAGIGEDEGADEEEQNPNSVNNFGRENVASNRDFYVHQFTPTIISQSTASYAIGVENNYNLGANEIYYQLSPPIFHPICTNNISSSSNYGYVSCFPQLDNNNSTSFDHCESTPYDTCTISVNASTVENVKKYSQCETFCTVPGRTSLLSSTTKYKVTIGEVQRRISPPECLNASLLGGILRKAKSKDGGKTLRESLKRIGLSLPAGRRKSANVTALTSLVEEEALHMARDFHNICQRDFPAKELAIYLNLNLSGEDAQRRKTMLYHVKHFIKEISDVINMDRSPICGNQPDIILNHSIQKPLTHFSMMTHGFGGLAFVAVLDALNTHVHESIRTIDQNFEIS